MRRSWLASLAVAFASLLVAALIGALVLAASHQNPWFVYGTLLRGSLGSPSGLVGTLTYATPLALTGLAATVAFSMKVWNIGADGQLFMGAFAATWATLAFRHLPALLMLPLIIVAGFAGGGLWALVAAVLRTAMGVNEIMSTLMLNYVAILWVNFLLVGPWKDPAMGGWPYSPEFPRSAWLPSWENTGVNLMLLVAVVAAVALRLALRHTRWGYELSVIGGAPDAARYAGMNLGRSILLVMCLSGGLAGLAGVGEVAGIAHRLFDGLDAQYYGYTGIMVAWLGTLRPDAVLLVAVLFGALLQGGVALQMGSLPPSIVQMLQGTIVLVALGCLTLARYQPWRGRLWRGRGRSAAAEPSEALLP